MASLSTITLDDGAERCHLCGDQPLLQAKNDEGKRVHVHDLSWRCSYDEYLSLRRALAIATEAFTKLYEDEHGLPGVRSFALVTLNAIKLEVDRG